MKLSRRARIAARLLQPAPAKHGFHRFASEYFDWNDPPFFKQFLRLDADAERLRVRCFGVSGCARASADPPVEDEFTVHVLSQREKRSRARAPSRAEPTPRACRVRQGGGPLRASRTGSPPSIRASA